MDSTADRADGAIQYFGDLFVAETVDLLKDDRGPELGCQASERRLDKLPAFFLFQAIGRFCIFAPHGRLLAAIFPPGIERTADPPLLAMGRDRRVNRDAIQPGIKTGLAAVGVQLLEGENQGFLGNVRGVFARSQEVD